MIGREKWRDVGTHVGGLPPQLGTSSVPDLVRRQLEILIRTVIRSPVHVHRPLIKNQGSLVRLRRIAGGRQTLRSRLRKGVRARVVAERGGLVHVDPEPVDVDAVRGVEEEADFVSPVPEGEVFVSECTGRNAKCEDLLLRLRVEPVRVDGDTGPYDT
jgi:FtsP/CotA-like multicopper oxidase with cupredoxin domain